MNIRKMTLRNELKRMKACQEAVKWVGDRDLAAAWAECERADWMLWYAAWKAPRTLVVRAACACARTALRFVPDGEDRPRLAIRAAKRWANNPTEENRNAADDAGADAWVATGTAEAAAWAAWTASAPAGSATAAAAGAAAEVAADATRDADPKTMADIVRSIISVNDMVGAENLRAE